MENSNIYVRFKIQKVGFPTCDEFHLIVAVETIQIILLYISGRIMVLVLPYQTQRIKGKPLHGKDLSAEEKRKSKEVRKVQQHTSAQFSASQMEDTRVSALTRGQEAQTSLKHQVLRTGAGMFYF